MEDKKVADAAWTLLTSFQEANRIVAEHLVAAQEHNRRLAEEFFTEGMEVLRANQQAAAESVAAQERSVHYTQRFFTEGMEILKANQAAAQSLVAAQERTMQYAERFFNGGIEVLKSQSESMRGLLHDLEQQVDKQREALATKILKSISQRGRDVLTRFYLMEQSQEQICMDMNLTDTQFRLLKSRAKARFAELGKRHLGRCNAAS